MVAVGVEAITAAYVGRGDDTGVEPGATERELATARAVVNRADTGGDKSGAKGGGIGRETGGEDTVIT